MCARPTLSGASWGTPVTIDSSGDVGLNNSLALIGGYPAISYYDKTNENLKYIRANDASGSTWGVSMLVDGAGGDNVGEYTSLAEVNGSPAISYRGSLRFARLAPTTPVSPTLAIAVSAGTTVNLSWGTDNANCNYTIYRSTAPTAVFQTLATAGVGTYSDPNGAGNPAVNYFYRVTANSCPTGAQTADSKTIGVFDFTLQPGN